MTAVIGLFAVLRAPKAEKNRFVLVGAGALPFNFGQTRRDEPRLDKSRQVEMGLGVSFVAKKKSLVARATLEQLGLEIGSDLIGCLADGRADGGAHRRTNRLR